MLDPKLIVAGALVGLLVGATGMGSGSLMTPLLVLVFGMKPAVAVGTDVVHGAIFKTVGALRHRKLGTLHGRLSGWMLIGSAPMSLAGVACATYLKHHYGAGINGVEGSLIGWMLIVGGLGMTAKAFIDRKRLEPAEFEMQARDKVAAVLIGLIGGFIVGLTSVGSGVFFGLTMLVVFPLRSSKVVGTDVLHAAALLWVAGAGHVLAGNVSWPTLISLLIGSIPGVLVGSPLSKRAPEKLLRPLMGAVVVLSGVLMLAG